MITESFDVCQTSSITALLMINYEQYPFTISVLKPYSYNYVSMLLMEPQCPTICSFHLHVEKSSYKLQHTYVCNVCVCLRCLYVRKCNMQLLHALEGVVKTLRERMRILWGTCIDYTV